MGHSKRCRILKRQAAVYHFRRVVPARIRHLVGQGEFWASLGTVSPTEARSRAGVLYTAAEEVFAVADELALLERGIAAEIEAIAAIEARRAMLAAQVGEMRLLLAEAKHHEATIARMKAAQARLPDVMVGIGRVAGRLDEARANGRRAEALVGRLADAVGRPPRPARAAPENEPPPKPLLSSLVEPFFARRRDHDRTTFQVIGQERGTLTRFLEACGDRPANAYERGDVTSFLEALRKLPTTYGKRTGDKETSLADLAARAVEEKSPCLSDKTVKRHHSLLSVFFQFAVDRSHMSVTARAELVDRHHFQAGRQARNQRDAWTSEDLVKLFGSPVWTGCQPLRRSAPGDAIVRDAKFWLPLLALYHGCRLEEFADLRRRDIVQDGDTWAVNLVETEGVDGEADRRLKTESAVRVVPLHPEVVRIGFLRYVASAAPHPGDPLFPDIKPQGRDGKRGPRTTRWFVEYRRAIGVFRPGVGMHAFRHTAITRLTDAIKTEDQKRARDRMMGHSSGGSEGDIRYDKGPGLAVAAATLALLSYPELDFSRLYVR